MNFGLVILFAVIGFALFGIISYYRWKKEQQRRQALRGLAEQLSCDFSPENDYSHDEEYANFEVFRKGDRRCAYNTLTGYLKIKDRPFPAKFGDFTYKITRGSGKDRHTTTYHFSYLIVQIPLANLPNLLIRPEGFFDKLSGVFGFDDIDFESAEFSKNYCVKSESKRFAYDVIDPRMMEFLLKSNPPAIDIENGHCCLSDGKDRWSPDQFRAMLTWTKQFYQRWPEHVMERIRHE